MNEDEAEELLRWARTIVGSNNCAIAPDVAGGDREMLRVQKDFYSRDDFQAWVLLVSHNFDFWWREVRGRNGDAP